MAVLFAVAGIASSLNNAGAEERGIETGGTFVPQVADAVNRSEGDLDDNTPAPVFEYTAYDNRVRLDKYIGDGSKVVIPSIIENKPVTQIGERAFAICRSLTTIRIPDQLDIPDGMLDGCPKVAIKKYEF